MSLLRYAVRRALGALLLMLTVGVVALLLARVAPGDFVDVTLPPDAPMAEKVRLRSTLGLDVSPAWSAVVWLGRALTFDFGESLLYRVPVAGLVFERGLNTLVLGLSALLLAAIVGLAAGWYTATRQTLSARLVATMSLVLLSVPPLLSTLVLVLIAARTQWVPAGGMTSGLARGGAAWFVDVVRHLPVPVLALALPLAATLERLQSQALAEAAARPFVGASRARGLSQADALRRHAWRVASVPLLGVSGIIIGTALSGSFVVEMVTTWPGLGRLMLDALRARDSALVAGCAATSAAALAFGTCVADVALAWVDPRVREQATDQ